MNVRVQWVLEVDIRKCFDTLDHGHLRELLRLRVRDGVVLRLIGKWLKAGVLEEGLLSYPDAGSPQGGVDLRRCWRTCTCIMCWMSGFTRSYCRG